MKNLLIFFLFYSFLSFGQSSEKIDSLKFVLRESNISDSSKINSYKTLVFEYMFVNQDSALFYINKLRKFSIKRNNDYGMYQFYYSKAFHSFSTSSIDSALINLKKSLVYAKKLENLKLESEIHLKITGVYNKLSQNEKAIKHVDRAIMIAKKLNDWKQLGHAYLELGNVYFYNSQYNQSIKNYLLVDSIFSLHKFEGIGLGNVLSNIGLIYLELKEPRKAKIYFLRSQEIYDKNDYSLGVYIAKSRLGQVAYQLKDYAQAIEMFKSSLTYYQSINDHFRTAETLYLLGQAYLESGNESLGLENLNLALSLKNEIQDSLGILETNILLSQAHFTLENYEKSIVYANNALNISKNLKDLKSRERIYFYLAQSNFKINQFEAAYNYLNAYTEISDTLDILKSEANLQSLEAKYETKRKEKEIDLLISEKKLNEQQRKTERILLIGGLSLFLIVIVFLFFQYRNRLKTNRKLKQIDKAKSVFFTNISHEFRTPLSLIKGPIEDLLEIGNLPNHQRKPILLAQRNTLKLEILIDQILALSKLESGTVCLQVESGNLTYFLKSQIELFTYAIAEKKIELKTDLYENESLEWFDRDILEKVMTNLIGNAVKYTPEGGSIFIISEKIQSGLRLTIKNSGETLSREQKDNVFGRFYQSDNKNSGFGVGLALTKELIELHYGKIQIESSNTEFTEFVVNIPMRKSNYKSNEILSETLQNIKSEYDETRFLDTDSLLSSNVNDVPILLIIDDNNQIRDYVASIFENDYRILKAANGKEGFEIAKIEIPDIIVSDIIMPVEDGFMLTNNIKENPLTSHIPIILLTGKAKSKDKIEAIVKGADAFIPKPFSSKLLKVTAINLIESRRKLQQRFAQDALLEPKDIAVSSADEKFLNRLQMTLVKNASKSDFTADQFALEMSVSRMQLHRKLKALTGYTTTEFLRNQRLKSAINLLKTTELSISEIGYMVGFNDISYFGKCFKKEFGCPPSDYKKDRNP